MTETTNAEKLRIIDGSVVWIIGRSIEESSLLDPLPEGAETVEKREENDPDTVDAAILFVDDRAQLVDDLDDVIPQLGSIPVVWIVFPIEPRTDVDADVIGELVADYGWHTFEHASLDETWTAVRLVQS